MTRKEINWIEFFLSQSVPNDTIFDQLILGIQLKIARNKFHNIFTGLSIYSSYFSIDTLLDSIDLRWVSGLLSTDDRFVENLSVFFFSVGWYCCLTSERTYKPFVPSSGLITRAANVSSFKCLSLLSWDDWNIQQYQCNYTQNRRYFQQKIKNKCTKTGKNLIWQMTKFEHLPKIQLCEFLHWTLGFERLFKMLTSSL